MTSPKFNFIDVRDLLLGRGNLRETLKETLQSVRRGQLAVINFLRLEAEAPATFREFLSIWASEFRDVALLFVNVRADFKVNLINQQTTNLLSMNHLIIPVFDQYCECMGWIGLPVRAANANEMLSKILFEGKVRVGAVEEQVGLVEILKKNPGLFREHGDSWSGTIKPEEVFEAEIKNEIDKRGAYIKDHIQLSREMHTLEYIEAIRFIEDQHFIERLTRQLFSLIKDNVRKLDCIVTFGHPGAILALALRSLLRSQGKELPYIVFRDEENPSPIKAESLIGKRALILFDVICAGGLLEKICKRVELENGEVGDIVTVVDIDVPKESRYTDRIRSLCHYAFKITKPEDCDECKKGHPPKLLYSYYKDIRNHQDREIVLSLRALQEYSAEALRFWTMVDRCGALREHVKIVDKDRHYYFYIDTFAIFKVEENMASVLDDLSRKVVEKTYSMPRKIVLFHAPNLSAQLLARELRGYWINGRGPQAFSWPQDIYIVGAYLDEGNFRVHEKDEKLLSGNIIIIDDGANTGDTLRALIGLCNRRDVERVDACIFEDRLSTQERDSIRRLLGIKRGELISLFRIPIPTFIRNPGDCPLCRERDHLSKIKDGLTTPEAKNYCLTRIKELEPIEKTEVDMGQEFRTYQQDPPLELLNLSERTAKALIIHLKGKLSEERKCLIPVDDLLSDDVETVMKICIVETLNATEIRNPRTSEALLDLLIKTENVRLFETIIRALSNADDWRFVERLERTKIKNIPRERLPYLAFVGELCQLKDGREKGNRYWPGLKGKVPQISEEEIEQIEKASTARGGLVGKSEQLNVIWRFIEKAGPAELSVLITGETGVGKELVAWAIHNNSPRKHGPFHKIEVTSIEENLLESELFGHQKGAFTGAVTGKPGKVEMAHKGSLFLDEIGDLPKKLQSKLLRFIEEKEFVKLGDVKVQKVDCRIIAATNKNLKEMVEKGKFREDLYYRLKVLGIETPPLRERKEDIPYLAMYFLRKQLGDGVVKSISEEAMETMVNYDWPGNVRELRHCVESAYVLAEGSEIKRKDLKISVAEENPKLQPLEKTIAQVSKEQILHALHISRGNQSQAAKMLGMKNEKALRDLMKKVKVLNPYPTKHGRPSKEKFDK